MAKFIAISGASTTGKTSLIDSLSTYREMNKIVFSPDMHDVVWKDLLEKGIFSEFTEIQSDSDYLCTYILRVIDYYHKYLDSFEDSDAIVLLDGCWLDLSIYSILQSWYTKVTKSVLESILKTITKYDERISRIYMTKADDLKYPIDRYRLRGTMTTFRENRPLELQYYDIAKHVRDVVEIPSSDISEASLFIIDDFKKLGYI